MRVGQVVAGGDGVGVRVGPAGGGEHRHQDAEAQRAAQLVGDVDEAGGGTGVALGDARSGPAAVSGVKAAPMPMPSSSIGIARPGK